MGIRVHSEEPKIHINHLGLNLSHRLNRHWFSSSIRFGICPEDKDQGFCFLGRELWTAVQRMNSETPKTGEPARRLFQKPSDGWKAVGWGKELIREKLTFHIF